MMAIVCKRLQKPIARGEIPCYCGPVKHFCALNICLPGFSGGPHGSCSLPAESCYSKSPRQPISETDRILAFGPPVTGAGGKSKILNCQASRGLAGAGDFFEGETMAYTMKEVAKKAGVSPATVSRVLNNASSISAETSRRVLEVVNDLHYFKNVHARWLATGHSNLLGLVISEITNPYFPELIRGFQAAAWDRGYDVLLCNTEYDPERAKSVFRRLVESDVRGVAIMTTSVNRSVTPDLTAAGIGVVFCNLSPAETLISNISIDYRSGIAQAIDHVIELGHRRVGVIAGPAENRTANMIKRVLVGGLQKRKLLPFPVINCPSRIDTGASAVRAVLSAPQVPTVIFCGSDLIAMGAMSALEEAGVQIPEEISVIGIDDVSFAFLTRPPLTTISVPREQVGRLAFQALDKMLNLKRRRGAEYSVNTDLVVRRSTARARKTDFAGGGKVNER